MRLIDADVLIKGINEIYEGYMTDECGCVPYDFERIVDEQPTVCNYEIAYQQGREEERTHIIDSIKEIRRCGFYCMANMCEKLSPTTYDCVHCALDYVIERLENVKKNNQKMV